MNRNETTDLWTKPLPEVRYLNADNVARYRLIMRYFYQCHTKLKYWLKPEDVYEGVQRWGLLESYTLEQCQNDLESLCEWKNVSSRHDGGRAGTIEEYLRKRLRYQMTPYSIEIERMLDSLEKMQGFGGSLEPTLLERIVGYVKRMFEQSPEQYAEGEALRLWKDLQDAFRQLHESASDYLASLQTGKAEEVMLTEQFLIYKDTLTHYLRNFISGLQRYGGQLAFLLEQSGEEGWRTFLEKVAEDILLTPTLEEPLTPEQHRDRLFEEWHIFRQWFVGSGSDSSDLLFLERSTKDNITRILRYALAIQERHRFGISRKKELDYLGQWFLRLDDMDEAHRLAACTFGMYKTRHYQSEDVRTTDSADISMWDEAPQPRLLRARSKGRHRGASAESVKDVKRQARQAQEAVMAVKKREEAMMRKWLGLSAFRMSELGALTAEDKLFLLGLISRCMSNASRTTRTPDGLSIRLHLPERGRRAKLTFEDGILELPDYRIELSGVKAR